MPTDTEENKGQDVPQEMGTPSQEGTNTLNAAGAEEKPKKRGPGRPRKTELEAKSRGGRKKVGRPKGDATIINEYKARMLASPKSRKVLETILDAATDPEHKHQAAAWKLVMDRILPVAAFEKDVVKGAGGGRIQINISGVPGVEIDGKPTGDSQEEAEEAEWTPINRD